MTHDEDRTMRVDPPTTGSRSGRPWPLTAIGVLISLLLLICGFELVSSLAGQLNAHHGWMLGAGLGATMLLPLAVGLWLRRGGGRKRRQPSSLVMIALINLLLLVACGVLAPGTCKQAVAAHGSWWVVRAAGEGQIARVSRELFNRLLALLPGEATVSPSTPTAPTDAAVVADAGISPDSATTDSATTPAGDLSAAGPVQVTFERRGSAIIVPVTLHGPRGAVKTKMLFDTGASLSTINRATADKLGLVIDPRDPTIVTHTAAGKARRSLNIVEAIDLAGARVPGGLAVTMCDPCAEGGVIGLLGLNYSRHFKVTLDPEQGQLTLAPKAKRLDHLPDIRPFVELKNGRGVRRGPQMTVTLNLHNRSSRLLRAVRVQAVVKAGGKTSRIWTVVAQVRAHGVVPVTIEGLLPNDGNRFRLQLEAASW